MSGREYVLVLRLRVAVDDEVEAQAVADAACEGLRTLSGVEDVGVDSMEDDSGYDSVGLEQMVDEARTAVERLKARRQAAGRGRASPPAPAFGAKLTPRQMLQRARASTLAAPPPARRRGGRRRGSR